MKKILLRGIGVGFRVENVFLYPLPLSPPGPGGAVFDPREKEIREGDGALTPTRLTENYGSGYKTIVYYDSVAAMMEKAEVDEVMIGTRCNTHTQIAIEVMKYNIPIFLEKPVCTTMAQARALYQASLTYTSQAVISFPLRMSAFPQKTRELIDAGAPGAVRQIEAVNPVT